MYTEGKIIIDGKAVCYSCKHFEEPSIYGIDKGRISKLELKQNGKKSI